MTGKVFLNYRRRDSDAWADRLFERLVQQLPRENIFMDIDGNIPVGFPWAEWLDRQVAACDLMLVLIGRTWVAELKARLDAEEPDFVRIEIESALKRKIPVVPVFLDDAPMPGSAELPETLRPLMGHQAARLQRTTFDSDAEALLKAVRRSIALALGEPSLRPASTSRSQVEGSIKEDSWAQEAEKRRFLTDVSWNDLTGTPYNDSAQRAKLAHRFEQFMKLPDADVLIDGLSTYVARCLPFPARTAYRRWMISALPQGYLANLSVGSQWTMSCFEWNDGPLFRFYGRGSILRREFGRKLERLNHTFCNAEVATEVMGGPDQMRLECRSDEVARLLTQEAVVEALRDVALYLAEGETPYKQHHCFDLADAILARARSI